MANARAIFERGNGFSYPNPYDPNPNAPSIYFQWFTWIWGLLIVYGHLDPGTLNFISVTVVGVVLSYLTLEVIREIAPEARHWVLLFFFAMWGGGITRLLGIASGYAYRYDVGFGWWFFNWGTNIEFATEALYHTLVLAMVLAYLREKWSLLLVFALLLTFAHPWTALMFLAIFGVEDVIQYYKVLLQ